jgi:hypothetical protein
MFKGRLKYRNGQEYVLDIPGVQESNGRVLVPESISFKNKLFLLNTRKMPYDHFEYTEARVPYRSDLH